MAVTRVGATLTADIVHVVGQPGELVLTIAREGDGWHVLIEGESSTVAAIPVKISTANPNQSIDWEV